MARSAPLPDAAPTNWVDAHAPGWARPWLKLGRFDRPAGIWLLMLPGWQGIALEAAMRGAPPSPWLLLLFLLGAALMRAAGCAYNDVVDAEIDAKVARTASRPIPAGQISVRQAWAFVAACCAASFLILLALSPLALALGVGSLLLVGAYPFMKRITWWPQAWLGLTFNWGALLGFAAAGAPSAIWLAGLASLAGEGTGPIRVDWDAVGRLGLPALLLYASGVFWTLGYDTIYAIQDLEDDALAGVKSSARRLGGRAPRAIGLVYVVCVVLAFAAGWTAGLGLLFLPFLAFYAVHLAMQARRVKTDQPRLALALFNSNVWAAAILFAGIALGAVQV